MLAGAVLVLVLASCETPPPGGTLRIVALAESAEITLTVVNTYDESIRFVGPAGNTFDVLSGESLSLRLAVVVLAAFDEDIFRPWMVPAGPVQHRLAELDEPTLVRIGGLDGQLDFLAPDGELRPVYVTARDCRGEGWRAQNAGPEEFVVRTDRVPSAPIRLCPGGAA